MIICAAITALAEDLDCSLEFGLRGGHQALNKMLQTEMQQSQPIDEASLDLIDAIGTAIGMCTLNLPEGRSFPLEPALDGEFGPTPACFSFTIEKHSSADKKAPTVQLVVRKEWAKRMESQADVGQVLWPAAEIMARWIAQEAGQVWQRKGYANSLEIGAGMGLTGLLAAQFFEKTVLSDFNPVVLRNLYHNCRLNLSNTVSQDILPSESVEALPSAFPATSKVAVRKLDWSLPDTRHPVAEDHQRVQTDWGSKAFANTSLVHGDWGWHLDASGQTQQQHRSE